MCPDFSSTAMGFDDGDAFGNASSVSGELLVLLRDVFAGECALLRQSGRLVGVGIASRVSKAIVLVAVPLTGNVVHHLVFGLALGWGKVSASLYVLGEEPFRLVRVVVQGVRPNVGDRYSNGGVGDSSDPLLPKVSVLAAKGVGEAGVVRGIEVKWFVVGDYEDGEGA